MTEPLFAEPSASDTEGLKLMAESATSRYQRSTRSAEVQGRKIINDLYRRFPDPHGSMRAALLGKDDTRFFGALDELLVHDLLAHRYRLGYEQGSQTRPDFRLYEPGSTNNNHLATVEVMTLALRKDWADANRNHAILADALNKRLHLTTHSVSFEIESWGHPPQMKPLIATLREALDQMESGSAGAWTDTNGIFRVPYEAEGIKVLFEFSPLRTGHKVSASDRIVVDGPSTGGQIDSAARLRDRLDAKASKYDLGDKPYAIVVGARDPWCTTDEVFHALVGDPAFVIKTGALVRRSGFFGQRSASKTGKRTQVSAVFTIHEWYPGGPYAPRITRYDNPFATHPFPIEALPFGGHWGVASHNQDRVAADWLVPPQGLRALP